MKGCEDVSPWVGRPRAQTMMKSDEVEGMLHLHALGWGFEAHRERVRVQQEHGETLRRRPTAGWRTADGQVAASSRIRRRG